MARVAVEHAALRMGFRTSRVSSDGGASAAAQHPRGHTAHVLNDRRLERVDQRAAQSSSSRTINVTVSSEPSQMVMGGISGGWHAWSEAYDRALLTLGRLCS